MELFIEIIKAIVLGVVEGITEWLPISSTGHMILVDEFLHMNVTPQFKEMFLVVIQLGAILAVVVLYWPRLWPFGLENKKIVPKKDIWQMWFKVIVSCVPAAVVGLLFDDELNALFYNWQTVAIMLIVFGVLFIVIESINKNKKSKINSIAELTYTSRTVAAEYTFFLAVPVMFGASALKLVKFGFNFTSEELIILFVGLVFAFVVSIIAIKFLMGYIKKHDFKAFGWYRIILGAIVLIYFGLVR